MIKKSSNLIGYILPKVSDDDKSKCVDAFIDAGHNIFCLPKELIKQKHVESYFNAEKNITVCIFSFIDVLDYTAIKKFINRDNTILAEIETVAKYFNQVYTKSSKKFTLEHSATRPQPCTRATNSQQKAPVCGGHVPASV